MQKIIINTRIGGYGLNKKAFKRLLELGCEEAIKEQAIYAKENYVPTTYFTHDYTRSDPKLLQVVDELGLEGATSDGAKFKIVEIPDGIRWYVHANECGIETIHEQHRVWK